MIEEVKKKYESAGKITISPYCDPKKSNMGLENYGLVVFPGTAQNEPMACIEQYGRVRYLNGLDETAPEISSLKDEEVKKAKILEIRKIVAFLEFEKHFVNIDPNDENFWNHVQTYKPNNQELWSQISVTCSNNTIVLDPINKTEDLIKILAIEAGGFPIIAKSKEDCISGIQSRKWFLDRHIETIESKVSTTKIRNKAGAKLESISENKPRKLFYIAKMISTNSIIYKNSTLPGSIYDFLDDYISGNESEPIIKKAAEQFLTYASLDMQELKIKSIVKDATFYKFVILKGDGLFYLQKENVMLGRNPAEIYEYLINPANEDVLHILLDRVEETWS